eukprot:3358878-Rhodomonas_salina.1
MGLAQRRVTLRTESLSASEPGEHVCASREGVFEQRCESLCACRAGGRLALWHRTTTLESDARRGVCERDAFERQEQPRSLKRATLSQLP